MKIDTRILARKCPNQGRLFQQFKEYSRIMPKKEKFR